MNKVRIRRLKKIKRAQRDLESALLTLKKNGKDWADNSFRELYYLVRLARRG